MKKFLMKNCWHDSSVSCELGMSRAFSNSLFQPTILFPYKLIMIDGGEILMPKGFVRCVFAFTLVFVICHLQLLGTYIRFVLRLHVVAGCKELGRGHPAWHLVLVPGHDDEEEEKEEDNDDYNFDEKDDKEEYDNEEEEDWYQANHSKRPGSMFIFTRSCIPSPVKILWQVWTHRRLGLQKTWWM